MDVKTFLLESKLINTAEVARLMWPRNATAKTYLHKKLHEIDGRKFTRKDALLAMKALTALTIDLTGLTVADEY